MKKLQWMPVLLTATAMSLTAYGQDQATETDALEAETDTRTSVEVEAGAQNEPGADTGAHAGSTEGENQVSSTMSEKKEWKEFSEVDKNGDGLLGIEEAKEALPEYAAVVDSNDDGVLNRNEAEEAMPEVGFTSGSPDEPVGPNDYETIRQQLESISVAPSPGVQVDEPGAEAN